MEISDYLTQTTGLSLRQLADQAGIDRSRLQRQLAGTTALTMETLRDVARGAGLDMIDLFLKAGMITEDEAATIQTGKTLGSATDEELALELLARARGNRNSILHEPIDSPKLSVLPRTVEIDADQYLAAKTDDQDDVREEDYPDA